ncbi:hypothetical protein AX15_004049 [Amanita polypyramis BW_CC]|nr:hypothetical protein AX15_004049 [Amanita polypyramis BW_CC]
MPPEQPADILLLGCGDVRNILYTVYADLGAPSRRLDFTCCDIDPAILARNVLLYTLLTELPSSGTEEYIQKIWNFYYHFFIDSETLDMVLDQCQLLVDLSVDISGWNTSIYGTFLRFCSADSLSALRRHWVLYAGTKSISRDEKASLHAQFRKPSRLDGSDSKDKPELTNLTSMRAAGPLWMELKDLGYKQYKRYWKTGVMFDNPAQVVTAKEINPTFAFSAMGKGFALHYASDPILSFHLAKALAPVKGSHTGGTVSISDLVKSAMDEFRSWCLTFNRRIKVEELSLLIRFLVGDAIAVSQALHYYAVNRSIDTGVYAMPWSSKLIKLDGGDYVDGASRPAPLQFDVIDTSNLTDHLALLNILVASRPLMRRRASSIIYTNTLHPSEGEGMARDGLQDLLCGDVSVMSMILDLIPVSYVSNFTSHSNVHETLSLALSSYQQFHEHIPWRIGSMSDSVANGQDSWTDRRLKFDERQLADFFYGVYLKMFSEENWGAVLQSGSSRTLERLTLVHYTRFSLAYLLRLVKDRVHIGWDVFVGQSINLIAFDRKFLVGSNYIQDLICGFHLLGIRSFPSDYPEITVVKRDLLKQWKDVPPVVCVTFRAPRKYFNLLEKRDLGTPILHCTIEGVKSHKCFQYYQCFFGDLNVKYGDDPSQEPSVSFEEDPKGMRGSSSVILTFYVPTWLLGIETSQKVTVAIRSSPHIAAQLSPILGPYLTLFSASLTNRKHVHITRERPENPGELDKMQNVVFDQVVTPDMHPLSDVIKVTLDASAKGALANGATVKIYQISPQTIRAAIGHHLMNIPYLFPINSSDSKTRIARKSAYVEVDVIASGPLQKFGMSLKPFPIVEHNKVLSLWSIHYIDLERLPALDLSSPKRLEFVKTHVSMSLSDRERRACAAEMEGRIKGSDLDVIVRVKQSIHHLFANSCGLVERKYPAACLSDPDDGGIYILIFFKDVCLDMASHTIVLDTCVVPLTYEILPRLSKAIPRLQGVGLLQVFTQPDEVKAWKHLLPAFTERCRKWTHTDNCEYLSKGVPVSEQTEESPLCTCGRGKNLGSFMQNKLWKDFAPYGTRAAISPLFAVPFVDTIGADILNACHGRDVKDKDVCAKCYGLGKPKLLVCAVCRSISYCSVECQKADWKVHKKTCKKI